MIKVIEIKSEAGEEFIAAGAPEKGLGGLEIVPLYQKSALPRRWDAVGNWPTILKFRHDLIQGKTGMITLKTFEKEYGELIET